MISVDEIKVEKENVGAYMRQTFKSVLMVPKKRQKPNRYRILGLRNNRLFCSSGGLTQNEAVFRSMDQNNSKMHNSHVLGPLTKDTEK